MIYFQFTTYRCNLHCTYCGGNPDEESESICDIEAGDMPKDIEIKAQQVADFLATDKDKTIVFYGGEPLMNIPFIQQMMDLIPDAKFILQSNCTMLHQLPTQYLKRFETILVSIDGRKETVTKYRGKGIYDSIIKNLQDARSRGFTGQLIARMACSMETDIYLDVMHFFTECPIRFDCVYWQLDAEWDAPMNQRWGDFQKWVETNYLVNLQKLFEQYKISCRTCNGDFNKYMNINPFQAVLQSLLKEKEHPDQQLQPYLRCSAGWNALSITTDGKVIACPVACDEQFNNLGNIFMDKREDMIGKVKIQGKCLNCNIYKYCGGRCLYANHTKLWGVEGFAEVCKTVQGLVDMCKSFVDELQQLIQQGTVKREWLDYPSEAYSLESIP